MERNAQVDNGGKTRDSLQRLREIDREHGLLGHASALLEWDQQTNIPAEAVGERAEQLSLLSGLMHDVMALNRHPLLPWDETRIMRGDFAQLSGDDLALLDRTAEMIVAGDSLHMELRRLCAREPRLQK